MPQSTEAAFREAIRLSPDEDLPRLVYADWLEEQSDPLGEFIRIQCELARLPWYDPRCRRLKRRELQLLTEHREKWLRGFHLKGARIRLERGFPYHISLPAHQFLERSTNYFEAAPIQSARLNVLTTDWKLLADCEDLRNLRSLSLHWTPLVSSIVFSQNLSGLTKLDLSEATMDDKSLAALFESSSLTSLRSLWLPNMAVNSDVLSLLLASPIGRNLKELRLPFLRASETTVSQLLRLLSYGNLERLDLPYVRAFADGGIWEFLASEHLRSLKVLSLEYGTLTEAEVFGILSSPNLSGLEELRLSNFRMQDDRATLPTKIPANLTNLKALDLANTNCPAIVKALLESETLKHLVWLRVEGNPVSAEGMLNLAASGCLSRFGELALRKCSLTADAIQPVLEASDREWIDELQLGMNPIGDAGAMLLAECPHLEQIRKLDLSGCGITSAGTKALAKSPYLRNLEELNLDRNLIDDRGARALALLRNPESLQVLSLRGNPISDKVKKELANVFGPLKVVFS